MRETLWAARRRTDGRLAGAPAEALGAEPLTLWCAERLLRALPSAAALPAAAQREHEVLLTLTLTPQPQPQPQP